MIEEITIALIPITIWILFNWKFSKEYEKISKASGLVSGGNNKNKQLGKEK